MKKNPSANEDADVWQLELSNVVGRGGANCAVTLGNQQDSTLAAHRHTPTERYQIHTYKHAHSNFIDGNNWRNLNVHV
jgi:hypothetical protein